MLGPIFCPSKCSSKGIFHVVVAAARADRTRSRLGKLNISTIPDLVRLVEERKNAKELRILEENRKPVAMLMPMGAELKKRAKKAKSQLYYQAFLAAAGSLRGVIDADKLKKHMYESRRLVTRAAITL